MRNLDIYKRFIDELVVRRPSVKARWVKEKGWPDLPENKQINNFLAELTPEQKEVVATIAQQARDGGIHDVLVLLNEEMLLNDLRISVKGEEIPVEPFGTELHFDWVCRCEGDEWPEPE